MDTGSILTLIGLAGAGLAGIVGGVWAFGIFVGRFTTSMNQNTAAIENLTNTVARISDDLRALKSDHNTLRDEVAHIRSRAQRAKE